MPSAATKMAAGEEGTNATGRYDIVSFTPINQRTMTCAPVPKPPRGRSNGRIGDHLFDLPAEPIKDAPPPSKRIKRTLKHSSQPGSYAESQNVFSLAQSSAWHHATALGSNAGVGNRSWDQGEMNPYSRIKNPEHVSMQLKPTDASLKGGNLLFGQATVDKLAAFRYQAPLQGSTQPLDVESIGPGKKLRSLVANYDILVSAGDAYDEDSPSDLLGVSPCRGLPTFQHQSIKFTNAEETASHGGNINLQRLQCIDSLRYKSIAPIPDDTMDEFPLDVDESVEMERLLLLELTTKMNEHQQPALDSEDLRSFAPMEGRRQLPTPRSSTMAPDANSFNSREDEEMIKANLASSEITCPTSCEGEEPDFVDIEAEIEDDFGEEIIPDSPVGQPPNNHDPEYLPLARFARPPFPSKVCDRSPIIGISSNSALRTCFRIGEARCRGALCDVLGKSVTIELFARVCSSVKDPKLSVYQFELMDLFHDGPPFLTGQLDHIKKHSLQEAECNRLVGSTGPGQMVRCLGSLRKSDGDTPGIMHILAIRTTDWEEVRWTKAIVEAGAAPQSHDT